MAVILSCKCFMLNSYKSSSPEGTMRVMESSECPPGMEILVLGPSSSFLLGYESWGRFWSVLSSDVWLQWSSGSPASKHSRISVSFRGTGATGLAGTSVSMLSSLSSLTTTSKSCWRRLLSTMETSLAFPSSNTGGGEPDLGLILALGSCLCHSSSCTWSFQDIEEEQLSSMASLKAICQASGLWSITFFHYFIPQGSRRCRQFVIPGA